MSSVPRVSVGLPVYNGERWLPATIENLLGQTFQDLELVITDNASTDGTEMLCRDYMKLDSRVRYFRNEKNLGVFNNFNEAFRRSRGEYFRWNATADFCHPRLIESCLEMLQARPDAVLSYPVTQLFVDDITDGNVYECRLDLTQDSPCERLVHLLKYMGLNNAQSGLIRSEALRKTKLIPSHIDGDIVLMMELSLYGKFVLVPEVLFYRRMKPETATALQGFDTVMRYIDPEGLSPNFQYWKLHLSRFSAVKRSPVTPQEKRCAYRFLFQDFRWDRSKLLSDIVQALKGGLR